MNFSDSVPRTCLYHGMCLSSAVVLHERDNGLMIDGQWVLQVTGNCRLFDAFFIFIIIVASQTSDCPNEARNISAPDPGYDGTHIGAVLYLLLLLTMRVC